MKKILTMLLVGLMVLGSFSAVYAEEPGTAAIENPILEEQDAKADKLAKKALKAEQMAAKLNLKKEFIDEIHQINALRVERNQLQIQLIQSHDQLLDLYIAARESGNKEALSAAKEERSQLEAINGEIKALHEQAKAAKEVFKQAIKDMDKEAAEASMENFIEIHTSINNKIEEKVQVLETIIDILS